MAAKSRAWDPPFFPQDAARLKLLEGEGLHPWTALSALEVVYSSLHSVRQAQYLLRSYIGYVAALCQMLAKYTLGAGRPECSTRNSCPLPNDGLNHFRELEECLSRGLHGANLYQLQLVLPAIANGAILITSHWLASVFRPPPSCVYFSCLGLGSQ